jgi:hypothetical protein
MIDSVANNVEVRANAALRNSSVSALRDLMVELEGRTLRLSGRVASYYHKQLAQEAVRAVADGWPVENSIDVD